MREGGGKYNRTRVSAVKIISSNSILFLIRFLERDRIITWLFNCGSVLVRNLFSGDWQFSFEGNAKYGEKPCCAAVEREQIAAMHSSIPHAARGESGARRAPLPVAGWELLEGGLLRTRKEGEPAGKLNRRWLLERRRADRKISLRRRGCEQGCRLALNEMGSFAQTVTGHERRPARRQGYMDKLYLQEERISARSGRGEVVHDTLRKSAYAAVVKRIYPSACPGNETGTKLPSLPADASASPLQKKIKESGHDKSAYIRLPAHLPRSQSAPAARRQRISPPAPRASPVAHFVLHRRKQKDGTGTAHISTPSSSHIPRLALRAPQEARKVIEDSAHISNPVTHPLSRTPCSTRKKRARRERTHPPRQGSPALASLPAPQKKESRRAVREQRIHPPPPRASPRRPVRNRCQTSVARQTTVARAAHPKTTQKQPKENKTKPKKTHPSKGLLPPTAVCVCVRCAALPLVPPLSLAKYPSSHTPSARNSKSSLSASKPRAPAVEARRPRKRIARAAAAGGGAAKGVAVAVRPKGLLLLRVCGSPKVAEGGEARRVSGVGGAGGCSASGAESEGQHGPSREEAKRKRKDRASRTREESKDETRRGRSTRDNRWAPPVGGTLARVAGRSRTTTRVFSVHLAHSSDSSTEIEKER
ncbi:hypothetical protein B0H14DRAFT_3129034 [Mycena olivaceomarginata]|nr:hypothetical protein B0H14DRAFT_3129034 [Mycena olivaceomarginata]